MKKKLDPEFAHDLMNRVGAAKMSAQLAVRNKQIPESVKSNLERIISNLSRIEEMVNGPLPAPGPATASPSLGSEDPSEVSSALKAAKSILIIDDSEDLRSLFSVLLRPRGYNVAVAKDGQEARQYLSANQSPNLILLDFSLKDETGIEVLNEIEKTTPKVLNESKVILFSAFGSQVGDPRVHAVEEKSMDLTSLIRLVEKYV